MTTIQATASQPTLLVMERAAAIRFVKKASAAGKRLEVDLMASIRKCPTDDLSVVTGRATIRVGVRTAVKLIRDVMTNVDDSPDQTFIEVYSDHDSVAICPL